MTNETIWTSQSSSSCLGERTWSYSTRQSTYRFVPAMAGSWAFRLCWNWDWRWVSIFRRLCSNARILGYTDLMRLALSLSMAWAVMRTRHGPRARNYGFEISYPRTFREPVLWLSDTTPDLLSQNLHLRFAISQFSCWRACGSSAGGPRMIL